MNISQRLNASSAGFIAALCLATTSIVSSDVVSFPDPNLEGAVRNALGIPSGDLTTDDMLTLTDFNAGGRSIVDTTGLETAVNLTNLVFNGNPVTNYSGFTGLANLRRLQFDFGSVSNIAFLAPLTQLEFIEIYWNHIEDLSPLGALTRLTSLQLDWNPVTNHTVLANLTNLTSLSLAGNHVSNLDFVVPLEQLTDLGLYDNQVKDLSLLAGRTHLRRLGLGWNGITNPAVLATLTGLEELQLNGNPLTNAPFLVGLTNLTGLDVAYTELADMSPLTNLARLNWANVGENRLADLPDLSALTQMNTFMMAGNPISNLSPLTNLSALGNLHVQRCAFTSLAPLADCPQLERLLLSGNPQLSNLAELGDLPALRWLEIQVMQITNLAFLTNVTGLEEVDLFGNFVTDLSPLPALPNLRAFSIEQNRLTDISSLLDCAALTYVNVKANYLDISSASAAWNVITNLQDRGVFVEYDPQNPPPIPIEFLVQPANRSAFVGDLVYLEPTVSGGSPGITGYQWEKDGVDLTDTGRITGTDSAALSFDTVEAGDTGFYRLRVWDDFGPVHSAAVQLIVVTNVAFADTNLEEAVRAELGIPTDPLTPGNMAGLYSLNAASRNITNLAGLEAAANLVGLNLSGNSGIRDYTPLTFLAALNAVALNSCELADLHCVEHLRTLNSLEFNGNFIQSLAPLANLTSLRWLWANDNYIEHIDLLLDLPDLAEVHVAKNQLNTNAPAAPALVISNLLARGVSVEFAPQDYPADTPVILTQPVNVAALPGDTISFSVVATSATPGLLFQWKRDGVNLVDGPGVSGAGGDTLYLDGVDAADTGTYHVRIWNDFGLTNSRTVTLRVVTNVAFVDPQLELAVRNQIGKPTGALTPADLVPMTWLDARGYGITNLAGIEFAIYLDGVTLSDNPGINDFTPLTALPKLFFLDLNACDVSDIAFVAALPPLSELYLWNGSITDLSPLLMHPGLRRLNLAYHGGITNFPVLNSLTNLEGLWMEGTGVPEISFAAFMPHLSDLSFESCAVSDLSPLAGATNLVWLDLANNRITNAAPLAGCTNLEWLSASGNQITNLDFVTSLDRLWFLAVGYNAVTNLSVLTGRTNLTVLDVGGNPLTDLSPVATLTRLTDLHVWNLGLSNNLAFATALPRLQVFTAGMNGITTLPLELIGLRRLNLSYNPLAGVGFVSQMTNLVELSVNGTGVVDLNPLAGRTNILELGLAVNGISDLSPLATLPFLRWMTLWDNHVQDLSALAGLTNLNYVDLRHNWLNTNASSAAMAIIATLEAHGTTVDWDPQEVAPAPITLSQPAWLASGQFRFTLTSAPGAVLEIWSSTNLSHWSSAGFVTNTAGSTGFTNHSAPQGRQFYRAQEQ